MNTNTGIENTNDINESNTGAEETMETTSMQDSDYEAAFAAELAAEEMSAQVVQQEASEGDASATSEQAEGSKDKGPPAYEAFIAAVAAHAAALGLGVKEQKGFFQFFSSTGHKVYVEKAKAKEVSRIDTSLPRAALVVNGKDISLPLTKPNGRIACHVDPSVESVKQALEVLATYGDKIPAPRKPAPKATAA